MLQPGLSEWPSAPPKGIQLTGFKFSYRGGALDWRLLHGIDPDSVVKLTDVKAIEDCLTTLQQGSIENEKALSSKNCIQLFRILQLSIEYVWHLRNAHASLLEAYAAAVVAAGRWKVGANQFLDVGAAFVSGCMSTGDIRSDTLEQVDSARAYMDLMDKQYNQALDKLEDEDQRARYFHFRKQRTELNWQQLCSVDLEALVANTDTKQLERVLHNLVFGCITNEDHEELTPHHFTHLIPLAQSALDYMMFQANASGAALEKSMVSLQGACIEIPALTAATQQLHTRITNFILEAQSQAAQLTGMTAPQPTMMSGPADMATAMSMAGMAPQMHMQHMQYPSVMGMDGATTMMMHPPHATLIGGTQGTGMLTDGLAASQRTAAGMFGSANPVMMANKAAMPSGAGGSMRQADKAPVNQSPRSMMLGGRSYMSMSAMQPTNMMATGPMGQGLIPAMWPSQMPMTTMHMGNPYMSGFSGGGYADVLALAATSAASAPALEMQAKAVEMHFRMEALESDLRSERTKAEDMRRLLLDIRDRVVQPPSTTMSSYMAPQGSGPVGDIPLPGYVTMDQLRAGGGTSDLGGRLPAPVELRARAARARTRGHRATASQAHSAMGDLEGSVLSPEDMMTAGDGMVTSSMPGLPSLPQVPAMGITGTDRTGGRTGAGAPAGMTKGRLGGRGHRRTASTSKSTPSVVGPVVRGGADTPPNGHSRQPSTTNLHISDLE